jgi:ribA/ribD-fused uncharacterized protein
VAELLELGGDPEYLYFWGHTPRSGGPGPWCLSQWWPARFELGGVSYASAEHFMMAAKARLFGDDAAAERIVAAGSPREAKALGRSVAGFEEERWRESRFAIVREASLAKFSQDPELRGYLLGTNDAVLVEASPSDRVWGIGLRASDERTRDPRRWRGENLLGFALMHARAALG